MGGPEVHEVRRFGKKSVGGQSRGRETCVRSGRVQAGRCERWGGQKGVGQDAGGQDGGEDGREGLRRCQIFAHPYSLRALFYFSGTLKVKLGLYLMLHRNVFVFLCFAVYL